MRDARDNSEEIGRRGQEIYETRLRARVETEENIGKIISIDVDTGDYEIDDDLIKAGDRSLARHPGASLYGARIGYDAVYAVSVLHVAVLAIGDRPLLGTALLDGYNLSVDFVASGDVRIQACP